MDWFPEVLGFPVVNVTMCLSPESLSGSQPTHQPDMKLIKRQRKTGTCCFRHPYARLLHLLPLIIQEIT